VLATRGYQGLPAPTRTYRRGYWEMEEGLFMRVEKRMECFLTGKTQY